MNLNILKVENLSHRYSGSWAIQDINFEIDQTGILGLLGSNGAGKSTTMNIMCGVLNQTKGTICINGIDMQKNPVEAKKHIGFLPQHPPLYLDLTVREYLEYCACLRLIPHKGVSGAVNKAMEKCGLGHFADRLISNLSGGYRQRVGIAQAIIHEPKLVILDEPTNGLDPNQITEVRALIKEIAEDRAVIFSSHILSEVQVLCKDIRMIENGRMVFSDSIDAFNNYLAPHSLVITAVEMPSGEELLAITGVTRVQRLARNSCRIFFDGDQKIAEIIVRESVLKNWQLREISLDKSSLDEIFAQLSTKNLTPVS